MTVAYRLPNDLEAIPSLRQINGVTVDLIEVGPWYNQMPGVVGDAERVDPGRYRHLVVRAVLRNDTPDDVMVELLGAYISFAADKAGTAVAVTPDGLTLMDDSGAPTGKVKMVLPGNESKAQLRLRGYGLYGEGHANESLYLTLILKVGDDRIFVVRRAGHVVLAM